MKRVLLIDYYGTCDRNRNPVGHSRKVLNEYAKLLKDEYVVSAAVSPCLVKEAEEGFEEIIPLKYDIFAEDAASLLGRIKDKLKLFCNIHMVLKHNEYDIFWFYRTDFFLFFYFFCKLSGIKTKAVAQTYQTEFARGWTGKILNYFYKHGAARFDGLIYTQKGIENIHKHTMYIPDYCYDAEKYGKYKGCLKKNKAVCIGTMNPYKKLEELVEAFNKNGMELEIKGYFYDKERFRKLLQLKKENILIEDVILSEEEYYCTLANAKYSLLPYDMDKYQCRTSGILQECMFLDVIAVAPKELLIQNEIEGLGYTDISELADKELFNAGLDIHNQKKMKEYDMREIRKKLLNFLN